MKKDGSGKELLTINAYNYMLCDGNSGKVRYKGNLYCGRREWNEETGQSETIVTRYDLDGQKGEEVCRFDFYGDVMVYGDRIYCYGTYGEDEDRISMYTIWNREMISLPDMKLEDCCVYKGSLYGLSEQVDGAERLTKVYNLAYDWSEGDSGWQMIYSNSAECTASDGYYNGGMLADLYATRQGVFLRQFVSSEAGVRWFSIGETGNVKKWEDEKQISIMPPASMLEYTGEWLSIKSEFESTEGYEEYLKEDLVYEAFYERDEEGEGCNPYRICLPQFQEKIEGYRKINAYFENAFQEALADEEAFFDILDEEKKKDGYYVSWCESTLYDYIYIGDKYITVAKFKTGYCGGIRNWDLEEPVTFDRQTGEVVTLEELFGVPLEEAVAMATGSVYKYMECVGRGSGGFFLQSEDILTQEYDPEQFFLFPEGIGIYYQRYAIDCGAVGDYLFIVPFPD